MRDDSIDDELMTVGRIAREAGVKTYVAKYHLETHGPPPSGRAGILRVWRRSELTNVFVSLERRRLHGTKGEQHATA